MEYFWELMGGSALVMGLALLHFSNSVTAQQIDDKQKGKPVSYTNGQIRTAGIVYMSGMVMLLTAVGQILSGLFG